MSAYMTPACVFDDHWRCPGSGPSCPECLCGCHEHPSRSEPPPLEAPVAGRPTMNLLEVPQRVPGQLIVWTAVAMAVAVVLALLTDYLVAAGGWWRAGAGAAVAGAAGWRLRREARR